MKNSTRTFGVKARAILAGSLVLGVGAAVTLASWNDSEFASSAFTGGKYNIQSSLNGMTWSDTTSTGPAQLTFKVGPGTLSPSTTVYAPFAVKLAQGTTNVADVTIKSTSAAPASPGVDASSHLTYTIMKTAAWGCDSSTTGSIVAPVTTPVTSSSLANAFSLNDAGTTAYLCIAVTADSTLAQSSGSTVTWELAGVSNAALTKTAL